MVATLFAGVASLAQSACGPTTGGRDWPIVITAYDGPVIDAIADDGVYTVRVQSPTPGWEVEIEGTERLADERRVFVSLTRPNPQFVYPAVIVEQLVRTRVPTTEPIGLYARVLEFRGEDEPAFERVGGP